MEEIISLVVANGLWAVLFCGLLVYELKDSRTRESRYTQTIRSLSERLNTVSAVKSDTDDIKTDIGGIVADTKKIRSDTETIKNAVVPRGGRKVGGGECKTATA